MSQVRSLGDTMGWPKRCQLLLQTLLRLLTADRGSRRAGCEGRCLGSPASAPGAFSREANVFLYLAPLHWNAYPPGR
jgi:hypothetical protein